jgi:hypothetical protein
MAKIAKPIVLDKRAARLAEIDAEIARLTKIKSEKQAAFETDFAKHITLMDHGLQSRLQSQIREIQSKVEKLRDERGDVELNGVPEPRLPKKSTHDAWGISKALGPAPIYPANARKEGKHKEIEQAHEYWINWHEEWACHKVHEAGIDPNSPVFLPIVTRLKGELVGIHNWFAKRCEEAEARLAALEDLVSPEATPLAIRVDALEKKPNAQYRGVWNENERYVEGEFVTHKGSVWAAKASSRGFRPNENPNTWQLAVRRGRDGRDADGRRQPQIEPED